MQLKTKKSQRATILSSYKYSGRAIPYSEYYKLIDDFMKFIADEIVVHGKNVKLPAGCGRLFIMGKHIKPKFEDGELVGMAPDWKRTMELWNKDAKAKKERKIVYFFNEHSNGVRYRVQWTKGLIGKTKEFYMFILSRPNKKQDESDDTRRKRILSAAYL